MGGIACVLTVSTEKTYCTRLCTVLLVPDSASPLLLRKSHCFDTPRQTAVTVVTKTALPRPFRDDHRSLKWSLLGTTSSGRTGPCGSLLCRSFQSCCLSNKLVVHFVQSHAVQLVTCATRHNEGCYRKCPRRVSSLFGPGATGIVDMPLWLCENWGTLTYTSLLRTFTTCVCSSSSLARRRLRSSFCPSWASAS